MCTYDSTKLAEPRSGVALSNRSRSGAHACGHSSSLPNASTNSFLAFPSRQLLRCKSFCLLKYSLFQREVEEEGVRGEKRHEMESKNRNKAYFVDSMTVVTAEPSADMIRLNNMAARIPAFLFNLILKNHKCKKEEKKL